VRRTTRRRSEYGGTTLLLLSAGPVLRRVLKLPLEPIAGECLSGGRARGGRDGGKAVLHTARMKRLKESTATSLTMRNGKKGQGTEGHIPPFR
jgi:hypothetical protein